MYLQKVVSTKFFKISFFVGVLKVNDKNSRIRIQIHQSEHGSADPHPYQNVIENPT
jgi:hypothetical protein